jgi:hypothetical protein
MGREERMKAQEAFRHDPDVQVLLATDAAGEGINLQRAHLMVNYDLPWNPNRIERRFGRIHRIGQTEPWRHLTQAISCPVCGKLQDPADSCVAADCEADLKGIRSPLAGLRFHDLRHHAITELAESQASDQTIMSIAGHVSQRMLSHYSHVRMDAKRPALNALGRIGERAGYDTKNDTKQNPEVIVAAEVIEGNGRHEETRTPDLYRVNFEVNNLKPFACLAFPFSLLRKNDIKQPSFGDESVTSFSLLCRKGIFSTHLPQLVLTTIRMMGKYWQSE